MKDMHIQGPQIHQFNNVAPEPIPRSSFKRDFTRRTTFNADYLIPCFVEEVLPGDDISLKMNALVRMSTPIKPLMDNLYLETFWFFIPNRLVWANWEKFQGAQLNPGDSVAYNIPVLDKTKAPLSTTGFANQSVYDYMGLPTLVDGLDDLSCLFNRAADLCWDNWFRDENLQDSLTDRVNFNGDGPDDPALYELRKRNKRKDQFTSGTPWPQKGDPVTIPLTGNANVVLSSTLNVPQIMRRADNHTLNTSGESMGSHATDAQLYNLAAFPIVLDPNGTLEVDGSSFDAITINALRQAALYQQILELDARGGTRYVESIYSRFGVISPDFRLQRPELIGQGSSRINVYAVPQTAPSPSTPTNTNAQGNLAGFATLAIQGDHFCRYSATEHGMILGFMNVRADLTYQQGVPKMFTRKTRLDFYEPLLNGLGEEATLMREIYAQGTSDDLTVHSYQERFWSYRVRLSEVTGKFRSNDPQTLNIWNVSQQFGSAPLLNSSFIELNTPMARILATGDSEPHFLADISYDYTHVRPMPIRSNPGIDKL